MKTKNLQNHLSENLEPVIQAMKTFPWEDPYAYAMWSAQTYHYVKYSTRLFSLAAAKCPVTDNKTHTQYLKHSMEEKGHENLSNSDLKLLGYNLAELPELPQTKALYQNQYFQINERNAYSFFGYLLTLEGLAVKVGPEVFKRVQNAHGKSSAKFLKVHCEEDVDHLAEVLGFLETVDQKYESSICENLTISCANYTSILNEIQTRKSLILRSAS